MKIIVLAVQLQMILISSGDVSFNSNIQIFGRIGSICAIYSLLYSLHLVTTKRVIYKDQEKNTFRKLPESPKINF